MSHSFSRFVYRVLTIEGAACSSTLLYALSLWMEHGRRWSAPAVGLLGASLSKGEVATVGQVRRMRTSPKTAVACTRTGRDGVVVVGGSGVRTSPNTAVG